MKIYGIKKDQAMMVFIGFTLPMIMGIIYGIVMKIFQYSGIIGTILGILFLVAWYFYGKYLSKNMIEYRTALIGLHGLLLVGCLISILSVVLFPNAPTIFNIITAYTNLYVIGLESITTPLIMYLSVAFEAGYYFLYLNLACVFAAIAMMGIFTIAYERNKED